MPGTGRTCGPPTSGTRRRERPGWDLGVLRGLGLQAAADTEIWRQVWTREERINNASTPMFLVEARKCPLPQ